MGKKCCYYGDRFLFHQLCSFWVQWLINLQKGLRATVHRIRHNLAD